MKNLKSNFWASFYKQAAKVPEGLSPSAKASFQKAEGMSAGAVAASTGAGAFAAATGVGALQQLKHVKQEGKVKKSPTIKTLQKQLKPGDILFTRAGYSPRIEELKQYGVREKHMIQPAVGSPQYHAAMYTGKGRVFHAAGEGLAGHDKLKDVAKGHDVVVYRPTKATPKELKSAVKSAPNILKKKKYMYQGDAVRMGVRMALDPTKGPKSCVKRKGRVVCTTTVTRALPKQFKREFMSIADMKNVKGMKPVARFNRIGAPKPRDLALSRGAYPALRAIPKGLGAAAVAYGGKKIYDYLKKKKGK